MMEKCLAALQLSLAKVIHLSSFTLRLHKLSVNIRLSGDPLPDGYTRKNKTQEKSD